MGNVRDYQYSEQQRSFIETSVIPFAFFRVIDGRVKTILVSDGLCVLLGESREDAAVCLEGEIYNYVHAEDVEALKKKCRSFFFGNMLCHPVWLFCLFPCCLVPCGSLIHPCVF